MNSVILSLLYIAAASLAASPPPTANNAIREANDVPVEQFTWPSENALIPDEKAVEKREDKVNAENVEKEDIEKENDDDKLIRYLETQEGIPRSLIDDVFKNDAKEEKVIEKRSDKTDNEQRVSEESVDENALEQEDEHLPESESTEPKQEATETEQQSSDDKNLQKRGLGIDGVDGLGVGIGKFGGGFGCGCRRRIAPRLRCFHRASRIDRWTCLRTFPTRVTWSFVFNKCSRFPIGKLIIVRKGCAVHVFLKRFSRCRRTFFPVCFGGRRFRKCGVLRNRFIGGGLFGVGRFGLGCGGCGAGGRFGKFGGFGGRGCGCPVRFGFGGLGGLRCGKFFPGKF